MGFESMHLDGYDLRVWCLSLLGYAGLTNNELELLLAVVICFVFLYCYFKVTLYSLYFSSIIITLFNTS